MKKTILLSLIFSFIFSGCSQKTAPIVFKDKYVCYELEKVEVSDEIQIMVRKQDLDLFKARKNELQGAISFYENQVDRYNAFCKKQLDKNFPRENIKENEI
ncbi:hypothetical protein [Aliarcobacter lanthieri]|uniref:hypothetical protein n=1 Tax=Aliarcobacter lanthieri TaxID=1355374 RepID=UPI00047913D0|nr:hypothetical protein [Aliarcobacter lanthieri]